MKFIQTDGGRAAAGYKGNARDCVTRAIAIASGLDYRTVYEEFLMNRGARPHMGVYRKVYQPYLEELGFTWVPTMHFGQGCTTHMRTEELPSGVLVCRLSRHVAAVIDGVLYDKHNCTRGGTRCVYGYFQLNVN